MKLNVIPTSIEPKNRSTAAVAVIGGGSAGSTCARELARRGHDVVLLEKRNATLPRPGETCGPGLRRELEGRNGLHLPRSLYRPLGTFFSAWGSENLDGLSYAFWHAEEGLVLDRSAFDEWLLDQARKAGVAVLSGCDVSKIRWNGKRWIITAQRDGVESSFTAGFIVEATGRAARSIVYPDAKRFFTDKLVGLAIECETSQSDESVAMIESCEAGWWYGVRLPNARQLIIFFTDADLVVPSTERAKLFYTSFDTTRHVRRFAEGVSQGLKIRTFDARTCARRILWRGSWLSVGDSAWCLDPLSGNGIERTVKDGHRAAHAITDALAGRGEAGLRSFALSLASAFSNSLAAQRRYYAAETRWRESVFWRRRC